MVNQQRGVQQDTAYSAVVVNDHMYRRPYIVFDPKGVRETLKNYIGRDGDTYDHPSCHDMIFILVYIISLVRQSYDP